MRVLLTLILSFLGFAGHCNPVFNQLQTLNKCWNEHKDVSLSGYEITDCYTAQDWISLHLTLAEQTLRKADISNLTSEQKANRLACLDNLHWYRLGGAFPQNEDYAYRTPIFIDKHDNFCAVGYLIKASGHEDISRMIAANTNLAYVREMKYPELSAWAKEYGFTVDELAWIQPTYAPNNMLVKVGKGTNGSVNEMYVDNNTQPKLYVGGKFSMIDSAINTDNIAYVTENNGLYTWHNMGSGVNGEVRAITAHKGEIYVAGLFNMAGNTAVNNIAKWNGVGWQPVGCLTGTVNDLVEFNGTLYAAGQFDICSSTTGVNFAKWNGTNWVAITGLNGVVNTTQVKNNTLYLGGMFSYNSSPANVITWNTASGFQTITFLPINHEVKDIDIYDDTIYVCCKHTVPNDYNLFYRLNGNMWNVYSTFNGYSFNNHLSVNTMCAVGDTFLIGGDFYYIPQMIGTYVAHSRSIATTSMSFYSSDNCFLVDSAVNKMIVFKNKIIVGGNSKFLGGIGVRVSPYVKFPVSGSIKSTAACKGGSDGTLSVNAYWGTPPYTYKWSTGDTTSVVKNVPTGIYTVIITDADNSKDTLSVNVANAIIDKTVTVVGNELIPQEAGATNYQWLRCDNGYTVLPGETKWKYKPVESGRYAVIIDRNGCVDTTACHAVIGTGVPEIVAYKCHIYPNPHKEELNIVFNSIKLGRVVKILDISGKIYMETVAVGMTASLKTNCLAPAVYILLVEENGKQVYHTSIVKE